MIKNFLKNSSAPKLIAEISANHNGSIINAKRLILTAKKNGADAVKLQTYTASTMVIKSKKKIYKITKGLWKGKFLWDIYKKGETPFVAAMREGSEELTGFLGDEKQIKALVKKGGIYKMIKIIAENFLLILMQLNSGYPNLVFCKPIIGKKL